MQRQSLKELTVQVVSIHPDCDKDSIIYLADPVGPSCHTGARTCWFSEVTTKGSSAEEQLSVEVGTGAGDGKHVPRSTLLQLEHTIEARQRDAAELAGAFCCTLHRSL